MIEWGPVATAGSAIVVLVAAGITVRQKNRSDRKDQWWKRTQWAMDLTLGDDEEARVLGFAVLEQQIESTLADQEDVKLLELPILGVALPEEDDDRVPGVDNDDPGDHTAGREGDP